MKTVILLVLCCVKPSSAVKHLLQYFYTASSEVPNFPEFVTVGMVDGQPFTYYDSIIRKEVPKQGWLANTEGPEYWEKMTEASITAEQKFKVNIETAKKRFNQTRGVHIYQTLYGCAWDDETGMVNGFHQEGFDGEDFLSFDLEMQRWNAPKQQAFVTKLSWDNNKPALEYWKYYLKQECPEWLKKYVMYGRSSLMKTVLPSVSLLQKTPSSPVSCHATGFYPNRAEMMWRKDGEELHKAVSKGEILPNNDETFQMSVDLDLSAVIHEDWRRYDCVFQLSGVKKDIVIQLDKVVIRTNEGKTGTEGMSLSMIAPIVIAVVVLAVIAVTGLIFYKKRDKRPPLYVKNCDVQEQMIPKA